MFVGSKCDRESCESASFPVRVVVPAVVSMAFSTKQRKCHILVVFLLYALFFLPLWVVLPALNEYVIARRCQAMHGIFNNTGPICGKPDVSESGQEWNTWIMLSCNIPSVLVVLPLGRLMDVRGRRPVLLWCLATQVAGSAGMLCVCLFDLDLEWFFPGYLVNGFGGGSYALQSILMASLTDVASSKKQRGLLLSCATASYYACGCVGPLLGGFVSGSSAGNSTSSPLELFPSLGGHQYQFAYLLFFSTNALLLLVAAIFWRETLHSEVNAVERLDLGAGGGAADKNRGHGNDGRCCSPKQSSWLKSFVFSFAGAVKVLKGRAIIVVALVFMLLYSTINVRKDGVCLPQVSCVVAGRYWSEASYKRASLRNRCMVDAFFVFDYFLGCSEWSDHHLCQVGPV